MNVDQLLAIVADLSTFTTKEQLEARVSQCQAAYDQLKGASGKSDPEKAETLLVAIARIQNKIAAIEFSGRREAQRALKAAARTCPMRLARPCAAARRDPVSCLVASASP